jgi:hypothetical protein
VGLADNCQRQGYEAPVIFNQTEKTMSIISTFARDNVAEILSEDNHIQIELKKLVHEVCHAYNLRVLNLADVHSRRKVARLVTENGISCGSVSVEHEGNNKHIYRAHFKTINKEKASAKSDRDTRDANKISSLIRAIKKNKEEPTEEAIVKSMRRDILAPFSTVESDARNGRPTVSLPQEIQKAAINFVLGIDTVGMNAYIDELKAIYSKYQSEIKSHEEKTSDSKRFRKGATVIGCVTQHTSDPHYLVADVSLGDDGMFTFHTPLKRYNTLKELSIAPVVMMINTFTQGRTDYSRDNEFGLSVRDKYYPELDISTGYTSHNSPFWVAIPNEAP